MSQADRLLRACRREPVDATPIWLMRQAGRYMSEYRTLRERYSILELIKTPELATEVTLQPIKAFNLDAAIIFADILPVLEGIGLQLEFIKGDGPVIGFKRLAFTIKFVENDSAITMRQGEIRIAFNCTAACS